MEGVGRKFQIEVDCFGWTHMLEPLPNDPSSNVTQNLPPYWQNITCDQMRVITEPRPTNFPDLADLAAVRSYFREHIGLHQSALISCDVIEVGEFQAVKLISKRRHRHTAISYTGSLISPAAGWLIRLVLFGTEHGITGVREALVFAELANQTGLAPEEFGFERYEPLKRGGFTPDERR